MDVKSLESGKVGRGYARMGWSAGQERWLASEGGSWVRPCGSTGQHDHPVKRALAGRKATRQKRVVDAGRSPLVARAAHCLQQQGRQEAKSTAAAAAVAVAGRKAEVAVVAAWVVLVVERVQRWEQQQKKEQQVLLQEQEH